MPRHQIVGSVVTLAFSFVASLIIGKLINMGMGPPCAEYGGLACATSRS